MRYDTPVYFIKVTQGEYDRTTGNYGESTEASEMRYASVMDTREAMMTLVYGGIKQGSLTAHIQNHYNEAFDYIQIDEKRYRADYNRKLRTKHAFILSEVQ